MGRPVLMWAASVDDEVWGGEREKDTDLPAIAALIA